MLARYRFEETGEVTELGTGDGTEIGNRNGTSDDGWVYVEGQRRCEACVRDGVHCRIDLEAIEIWRLDVKNGKIFTRNPAHTNCRRCTEKKTNCILPDTEYMRRMKVGTPAKGMTKRNEVGQPRPGKRKRDEVQPRPCKRIARMPPVMTEEDFWRAALRLLGSIDGRLKSIQALYQAEAEACVALKRLEDILGDKEIRE